MFGFSLAELILVFLVALIFIKPQDLPEIAHFFGKIFYRGRRLISELKQSFKEMEKELGIDDLKHELNRGIAEEKAKLEEEMTVIVDIYGNEHRVANVRNVRPDLTKEEMAKEIKKLNDENLSGSTSL
jgi:Sec-independent protein translocase protein TatA